MGGVSKHGHLAVFFLLALIMQTEDGFIHHPCEQEYLVDLLAVGNAAELVVEGDGDLGFEEFSLLLCGCHILSVSKLISIVKFLYVVFDMQF